MLLALSVAACSQPTAKSDDPTETARRTYLQAMEEFVAGNYLQATQLFGKVARAPRYVRYAALARLRIGDALFRQQRFEEAIEAYRSFASQYGSDANLPYARFRIAQCFHERIPYEWFASPPRHEMDQTMTRQALRELENFVRSFPTSRFTTDAQSLIGDARATLLAHELYVADYYAERGRWLAEAWRLDQALTTYPDLTRKPGLLWRLAGAYQKAGDAEKALTVYARYMTDFPDGPHVERARGAIESIRQAEREQL